MTTTTSKSASSATPAPYSATPPYLVCHIQTPDGRLYQINGCGFVTPDLHQATRHPVDPGRDWLVLEGPVDPPDGNIHCVAPLFITRATPDQVEVAWGSRTLRLSPDDLVAEAGRRVWRKVQHFHRTGYPFGQNVQLAHNGSGPSFACFNIEIHPPSGETGYLHPAPDGWDSSPRDIQTHLGLLGFAILRPGDNTGNPTVWRRPLHGADGAILLETGLGTRSEGLVVEVAGAPAFRVTGFHPSGSHASLHRQLVALIRALESPHIPDGLPSLIATLFPAPLQILTRPCP